MAIVSTREAQRLGRLGGIESSRARRGNSAWGHEFGRHGRHRWQKKGGRMLWRCYPTLALRWLENARRAKANRRRTAQGLPLLALIPVSPVDSPAANRMRELRSLRKRRAEYERQRAQPPRGFAIR